MSKQTLTSKPLTRQQITYAKERCRRIASRKKQDLDTEAAAHRHPELTDYDRTILIKSGEVSLDVSRVKPDRSDRHYYSPRVVDCADFSDREQAIATHNKAVDRKLSAAKEKVSRRENAIIDRFELGESAEALDLLTKFEAEEFTL